ncbi:MAG: alpha/beta hydrolase family protein [Spirochaetota bacterium]
MPDTSIRRIARGRMVLCTVLTLIYELLHLTPLRRLVQNLTFKVSCEKKRVGDITLEEYCKGPSKGKPLVFMTHGYGSFKERMKNFALQLADKGYFVVTPDALAHGERNEPGRYSIIQVVERSVADIDALIDHYQANSDVDSGRFSIVGRSMGGFVAYSYLVNGRRSPRAIAPTISSPDSRDLMNYQLGLSNYENHRVQYLTDPSEIALRNRELEQASLLEGVTKNRSVAVIVQNMRFDFLVGSEGSDRLYEAWKDIKKDGTYRYVKVFAFFHYIPDVAKRNVIKFFAKYA